MNSPNMPPYSVSKMGVVTFTKIVAKELAQHNVNVNAICPGILWTSFWQETAERLVKAGGQFADMTPRQVFENRRERDHPDEKRADARGHRQRGCVPGVGRRANIHGAGAARGRRRRDVAGCRKRPTHLWMGTRRRWFASVPAATYLQYVWTQRTG